MSAAASTKKPIRIALVDDDQRVRESLGILIDGTPGFQCAGAYSSAAEALTHIPLGRPDVVLMDINLGVVNGIECVRQLKSQLPSQTVVMLTSYEDEELIFDALKAGANGYLLKQAAPTELLSAISEVHSGGAPMSSNIARKVIQSFHEPSEKKVSSTGMLTAREREVLQHLAKGYLNKEIASSLAISVHTVKEHLQSIYNKLHVRSRGEAIHTYLKN